jgi:hypothetical protein
LVSLGCFRIGTVALPWFIDGVRFNDPHYNLVSDFQSQKLPYRMLAGGGEETSHGEAKPAAASISNVVYYRSQNSMFAYTSYTDPLAVKIDLESPHQVILACYVTPAS